jgi:hypothetical protein
VDACQSLGHDGALDRELFEIFPKIPRKLAFFERVLEKKLTLGLQLT